MVFEDSANVDTGLHYAMTQKMHDFCLSLLKRRYLFRNVVMKI
uniref:Uncharacterized protein n=1 Tax=Setaria italica TaxID=4555 RepID=K4A4I2_SETIT